MRVSELCLGAMTFGGATPLEEARAILDRFADAGGNFVDTAVNYAGGASEEMLGRLIAGKRERFVVATKYGAPLRAGDPGSGGNHARGLRQALELSLRRLGTDYVDLLWVHAWDQITPLEELVRVLEGAVRSGKVLQVGISNTPAWAVARADALAEASGSARPVAIQVEYNLAARDVERELVPMSRELGMAVIAWGPLAGGLLTGKYLGEPGRGGAPPEPDSGAPPPRPGTGAPGRLAAAEPRRLAPGDRRLSQRNLDLAAEAARIAAEHGADPAAVALAWLLARPARPLPILGVRTAAQLDQLLACLDLRLPDEAIARLDGVSAPELGYPHDFLARVRAAYAP
jgi:aryl-alcohol dehydrogenase-like predicted oxidoreductase